MYVKRAASRGWDSRQTRKDSVPNPATTRDQQQIERTVAALPHFRGLSRARLAAIFRGARLVRARRGDFVTRRSEPLPGVFAVAEGMVKLALRRADGAERVLRFVGPGETFGEAAVLLGRDSAVDAVALADTVLVAIAPAQLRSLMGRDAELSRRMAALLAERMLALMSEVEASELRPAGERLAAYLLGLAEPAAGDGRLTARLPATKTLVAARLGMKKETLSRLLHDLVSRHLIEVSRREISILDRGALSEIAHA